MLRPTCFSIAILFTAIVTAISGQLKSAAAQETVGVRRTFAVISLTPIDFQSDDSIGVVVSSVADESPALLYFHHTNSDQRLDDSIWVYQNAFHVTAGGEARPDDVPGAFVWLIDADTPMPPPTGAVTFARNSMLSIESQTQYRIKLCDNDTCGFDYRSGDYVQTEDTNSPYFTVVTAIFSH